MTGPAYAQEGDGGHLTGRSEPRQPAVACDVRFGEVAVSCGPHGWGTVLEAGHDVADLQRLVAMHCGETA